MITSMVIKYNQWFEAKSVFISFIKKNIREILLEKNIKVKLIGDNQLKIIEPKRCVIYEPYKEGGVIFCTKSIKIDRILAVYRPLIRPSI